MASPPFDDIIDIHGCAMNPNDPHRCFGAYHDVVPHGTALLMDTGRIKPNGERAVVAINKIFESVNIPWVGPNKNLGKKKAKKLDGFISGKKENSSKVKRWNQLIFKIVNIIWQ